MASDQGGVSNGKDMPYYYATISNRRGKSNASRRTHSYINWSGALGIYSGYGYRRLVRTTCILHTCKPVPYRCGPFAIRLIAVTCATVAVYRTVSTMIQFQREATHNAGPLVVHTNGTRNYVIGRLSVFQPFKYSFPAPGASIPVQYYPTSNSTIISSPHRPGCHHTASREFFPLTHGIEPCVTS